MDLAISKLSEKYGPGKEKDPTQLVKDFELLSKEPPDAVKAGEEFVVDGREISHKDKLALWQFRVTGKDSGTHYGTLEILFRSSHRPAHMHPMWFGMVAVIRLFLNGYQNASEEELENLDELMQMGRSNLQE